MSRAGIFTLLSGGAGSSRDGAFHIGPRPLARQAGPPSVSGETMAMDGFALLLASEAGKRSPRQPQVFQCNYAVKHRR